MHQSLGNQSVNALSYWQLFSWSDDNGIGSDDEGVGGDDDDTGDGGGVDEFGENAVVRMRGRP